MKFSNFILNFFLLAGSLLFGLLITETAAHFYLGPMLTNQGSLYKDLAQYSLGTHKNSGNQSVLREKRVSKKRVLLGCALDCGADSRMTMPRVGRDNPTGQVNPLVAAVVTNQKTFGLVPDDTRHGGHGPWLDRT